MATSTELIRVEHVYKIYNNGAVKALNDCCASIRKGEVVSIIGPSGSGKTTVVNLLTRFYDVDEGEILFDGVNINDYTKYVLFLILLKHSYLQYFQQHFVERYSLHLSRKLKV